MSRVRANVDGWRDWIHYWLPHIVLVIMGLVVRVRSLHDNVPPPQFLPGATNITVRPGDVAILPCAVKHLGTKQVTWRRADADDFLTIGTMTWIGDQNIAVDFADRGHDVTNWNLVIDHVTPEDSGIYECQVTSKHGFHKIVKLNVVGPPITEPERGPADVSSTAAGDNPLHGPVTRCGVTSLQGCLISITGKRYVDLGEKIHLVCNASGGSRIPEDIDWFKDGDMIDSMDYPLVLIKKYQSFQDKAFISELIIDRARLRDSGEYVCRSSRNNIVNMKVTVLRAESPAKRRGTGTLPSFGATDSACRACDGTHVHTLLLALLTQLVVTWRLLS